MSPIAQFDPADITAAILAGGEGKRLGGRDKGLELLEGRPLIAHALAALAGQAGSTLICINRDNANYVAFAITCVDRVSGRRGPLAGIDAALAACETSWLLTVPVDCPLPPADLAQRLHAAASAVQAPAAVAHDGERRQPLFALYRRELLADAAVHALARDLPVWRWQDEYGVVQTDFSDVPNAFLNLNTTEDFHRWKERNHG